MTPKNKPPLHMCYHVKFGRPSSVPNCVCINRRELQNWGALGWGAWLTPRNTPLPMCHPAKFGRSGSNGTIVIIDPSEK